MTVKKLLNRFYYDTTVTLFGAATTFMWIWIYTQKGGSITGSYPIMVVYALCFFKLFYFLIYSLELIVRSVRQPAFSSPRFLAYIVYILVSVQVSFAFDYLSLVIIDPTAMKGIANTGHYWDLFFNLLYFSVVTFATVGYGDITAGSLPAKGIVMIEIMSSFIFIIIILSNFTSLRAAFTQKPPGIGGLEDLD